jgi:hypothetical protein
MLSPIASASESDWGRAAASASAVANIANCNGGIGPEAGVKAGADGAAGVVRAESSLLLIRSPPLGCLLPPLLPVEGVAADDVPLPPVPVPRRCSSLPYRGARRGCGAMLALNGRGLERNLGTSDGVGTSAVVPPAARRSRR